MSTTMLIWFISALTNGQNLPQWGFGVFCAPLLIGKAQHVISLKLSRRPVCVSDLRHTHTHISIVFLKNLNLLVCSEELSYSSFFIYPTVSLYLFSLCGQLYFYILQGECLPTPVGFCVIYTGLVPEQTGRLFFCLIDCCDQFVFSSPFLFCVCLAEIVIEHIDRLTVGSIDRQGQSPGQWKMALQCPPVLSPASFWCLVSFS